MVGMEYNNRDADWSRACTGVMGGFEFEEEFISMLQSSEFVPLVISDKC